MNEHTVEVLLAVFGPIIDIYEWIASFFPSRASFKLAWPHLNFITVHYLYLISWTIVGSIILYGASFMSYIDALFFAAGSATQSGLNPLNVNELHLYQQITMMLVACVSNPIFINTVVVFVRLYWFEKRFEHIVKDIREQRKSRTRSFSKSKSQMRGEEGSSRLEMGIGGRQIKVLHETTQPNGMSGAATSAEQADEEEQAAEKLGLQAGEDSVTPSRSSGEPAGSEENVRKEQQPSADESEIKDEARPSFHRDITFADELPTQDKDGLDGTSANEHRELSKHIEFLERQQRNAKEGGAIRIPGPRDFDRGEVPQQLDQSGDDMYHPQSGQGERAMFPIRSDQRSVEMNGPRGGITFNEPEHPGHRDREQHPTFDRTGTTSSRFSANVSRLGGRLRHRRSGSGALSLHGGRGSISRTVGSFTTARSRERDEDPMPYLSYVATTGRNSAFVALTAEQRDELGGIEYRALKTLALVLVIYFLGFHILGMVVNTPWIIYTEPWRNVVVSDGVDPGWWGVFTSASLFNDLGLTLTPDSMNSFNQSTLTLLLGSFLIVIGNTGFPVMLRFVIWLASKLVPRGSAVWEELRFLLDHPRRCFTLLFPSKATWWLFWILVLLNGIDLIFYIILDLNDPAVTDVAVGYRVLDGWFQATSTRTAGFSCVNLADLHPGIQVSYLIMMYISVFPIAISVRRTNVYEEKSLGIWGGEDVPEDPAEQSYVGQHLRRQLSFDLWFIFLGFFIICIVEGQRLQDVKLYGFSLFSVLFEIVSAYGTVGLSLGYPNTDTSFSAQFKVISKLVVIAMMIRGRHRGLPYALDRAILLPSEKLQDKEAADAERRYARRGSVYTEGHDGDLGRHGTWENNGGAGDENGMRGQLSARGTEDATLPPGAGVRADSSPEATRRLSRRGSQISNHGEKTTSKTDRSRSLGKVLASGLSAGPTISKHE